MLKLKTSDAFFKIQGMDGKTGKELEGIGHLKQSIIDILTTPIASRITRREYGL